ncbi:hypothetical protein ACFSGX_17220 [Sphingomonas arantia]|uniref:Uncharacterized protein n=1 Tax=Sphingomonas arantia TaxID=1460676 RepID=A0ABW4U2F6_9SPHN
MFLPYLLLIQQAFGPPVPAALRAPAPRSASPACAVTPSATDITVCARRGPDQRLSSLPEQPLEPPANPTTFRLPGGGSGSVNAAQSNVNGFTGQAAKLTLRIPFGKGKRD